MFEKKIKITQADLESPYNHVHHADILKHLELVRRDMLLSIGITLEELYRQDLFPVIRRVQVEYLREILLGEYTVKCLDFSWSRRSYFIKQQIFNELDKKVLEADFELMFLSQATKRSALPSDELINSLVSL